MFSSIAMAVVALISQIMPYIGVAGSAVSAVGTVGKIIAMLEALVPALISEAKDLYPTVKDIIATLKGSSHITKEQLDSLDAIETKIDADFDTALAKAEAEDAAVAKA